MEHRVGRLDEFLDGQAKLVEVAGRQIGIIRKGSEVFALRNLCPHKRAPLLRGSVEGTMLPTPCAGELNYGMDGEIVKCPWHGWEFDIKTGKCLFGVSNKSVRTYAVSIRDGDVFVSV